MMDKGADAAMINRVMFDTKSRARLEIERRVLDTMSFYFGGKCAVAYVTREMVPPEFWNKSLQGFLRPAGRCC